MRRFLAILLSLVMVLALITGCGQNNNTPATSGTDTAQTATAESTADATAEKDEKLTELTLPLTKDDITLTLWAGLSDRAAASIKNYGEMLAFQELQKRTGVTINFIHPAVGQEKEQFSLLLASGDLPDIIHYNWGSRYPGGPQKAIDDGAILKLNDLIEKNSPNFSAIMAENVDVAKNAVTDDGTLYMYPLLRIDAGSRVSGGLQIRKDWLDKVNLPIPTTIDEWYTVLTAFKNTDLNGNGKADEIPFISTPIANINGLQRLIGSWGIGYTFYNDNGTVKYGPAQPEYKDFLQTMQKWYAEGLIDPDFLTTDRNSHDAKVTSGIAGSFYGLLNSYMGTYTKVMAESDPNFKLVQAPYPKAPDGKMYNFKNDENSPVADEGMVITTANKHPELSAQLLDYFYSEDGRILLNLGVEGETYTVENGKYKYTEIITKNPDGLSLDRAAAKYMPVGTAARLYQDLRYWEQMMTYDNQKEAMGILAEASIEKTLPPITPTSEESIELASIQNELTTYVDEMFAKFILGQDDISKFDDYIKTLESLNLARALEIQQEALKRYEQR